MTIQGGRVVCTIEIRDNTSAATPKPLVDPSALTVKYGLVEDATPVVKVFGADVEVVKVSVGIYQITIDCPDAGRWATLWEPSGTYKGSLAQYWSVDRKPF